MKQNILFLSSSYILKIASIIFIICLATYSFGQSKTEPIIDMHVHAYHANFTGMVPMPMCVFNEEFPAGAPSDLVDSFLALVNNCKHKLISDTTDELVMSHTLSILQKRNIYGVTSGELTENWYEKDPKRIIPAFYLRGSTSDPTPDSLRKLFKAGKYKILGEVAVQYRGMAPDDSFLNSYWKLAEELDIPVGIHIGPGPLGAAYLGFNKYRGRLHDPLKLEEILVKHPKLRVYIMHAAWPMIDNLLALMWNHPQVYVDISGIATDLNNAAFHSYLKQIVQAGFCNRIMYGSDQMIWPELINKSIEAIETADFLTEKQKRDIFYNNAARFLKLSPQEISNHHNN